MKNFIVNLLKMKFTIFKRLAFFLILLNYNYSFAQNFQEYLGIIKLNDSSYISYRLNFTEKKGEISGYSITDIGGDFETKSNITGNYNPTTNTLFFKEVGIVYTKSEVSDYDFCFIHFNGKLKNLTQHKNIEGTFKGYYADGTTCINGEIAVKSIEKIEKKAHKADKFIQKSNRISDSIKATISVSSFLDSLKMNVLKANQNLSMFTNSNNISLKIYDAGKVDGDKISIYINNTALLKNYEVSKTSKIITIPITSEKTTIQVIALNVGSISPNTAKIEISDQKNNINTLTSLKKGEKTTVTILKL